MTLTTSHVLAVICQIDCDQAEIPSCHESAKSLDGSAVRSGRHGCDHDHLAGSPALVGSLTARDLGEASVVLLVALFAYESDADAPAAIRETHGPPGLSTRSNPSTITILRI